jgi:hypothetical protein
VSEHPRVLRARTWETFDLTKHTTAMFYFYLCEPLVIPKTISCLDITLSCSQEPLIYLIEQLPGKKYCERYSFQYHETRAKKESDDEHIEVGFS